MGNSQRRVFGVDFSGASEPGASIWLSEANPVGDDIEIITCLSARDYFHLPRDADRSWVYENLRELVIDHPNGLFGFDFSFGLPHSIIGDVDSWEEHIRTLDRRFNTYSANAFQRSCIDRAHDIPDSVDSRIFLRRETDVRYAAQSPYQPHIQYQTLYGQLDILQPLIEQGAVRVPPMQNPIDGMPIIVEVYPAATLGVLRLHRQGYKHHSKSKERRMRMLDGLRSQGHLIPDEWTKAVHTSDDALDSIIAAIGATNAWSAGFPQVDGEASIEGQIFA